VDEERWAAVHYRVERDSRGVMMRKRQRRKATEQAIEFGDPVPDDPHDVVRIYDREGNVAFEQDWGTNRPGALAQEAKIVDDLLTLDVLQFRARYGIIAQPDVPPPPRRAAGKKAAGATKKAPAKRRSTKTAPGRPKRPSG
jgi:hypothetical protein